MTNVVNFVSEAVKNIVGKRAKAGSQHFVPLSKIISINFFDLVA